MKMNRKLILIFFVVYATAQAQTIDSSTIGLWKVVVSTKSKDYDKWRLYQDKFPDKIKFTGTDVINVDDSLKESKNEISYSKLGKNRLKLAYKISDSEWNGTKDNDGAANTDTDTETWSGTKDKDSDNSTPLSFWGLGELKKENDSLYTGNYNFRADGISGEVTMQLEKIWCCGNHTPEHCDNAITKDCKKLH